MIDLIFMISWIAQPVVPGRRNESTMVLKFGAVYLDNAQLITHLARKS